MEYIEISGKTVEDAITNASVKLGVTSDRLDYEIIEKGSKGILGIGSKNAVIKVREKQEEVQPEVKASVSEAPVKEGKPVVMTEKKTEPVKTEKVEAPKAKAAEVKSEDDAYVPSEDEENVKPGKKAVAGPNMEPAIKKFLTEVLGAMGMTAEIEVKIDSENSTVDVNIVGKNMGVLIGKRGQTLDSLQYLVSLVANKECEGYFRVKLDTENYRARRKETLESLAKNISYKVKRTRRPVSLEPMNPYERRIIHSALQNDPYVITKSEGEEPFRHVVVCLKKNNQ